MGITVKIPKITFPGFKIPRGLLLNTSLLGVDLVIPPFDITFWEPVTLIPETIIWDSGWVGDAVLAIQDNLLKPVLDKLEEVGFPTPENLFNAFLDWTHELVKDWYEEE